VVVALGAGRAAGVREQGTRATVAAMRERGVRRLVCLSTLGAGESRANLNFVWKHLMFGLLLRAAYADHQRQEQVVRESGLDWTLVRPSAYTDGPHTGAYRYGFGPEATDLTLKVSRADVADALLRALADPSRNGTAVSVSNRGAAVTRAGAAAPDGASGLASLAGVDVLEALLDGPRARGAFLLRSVLEPPWALRIADHAPLTVAAVMRGDAWLALDDGESTRLATGDVAIVRGPGCYTVADEPGTDPTVVIGPGGHCTSTEDGRSLVDEWSLGVRTWGAPGGSTVLL